MAFGEGGERLGNRRCLCFYVQDLLAKIRMGPLMFLVLLERSNLVGANESFRWEWLL